jgi:AcrR family transcriptional regulator
MNGRAQPPSRRAAAGERRDEIVAAAADLFAAKGYRGTGLAEIASRVGITQAGVLYHFKTKAAVLRAVIEKRDIDSEAFALELLAIDVREVLDEMATFALRNRERAELAKLFAVLVAENLEDDAPAHEHFVGRYRALRAIIASIIRKGQQQGHTRREVDPELKAAEIIATLDGLQTQWLLDPDQVDIVTSVAAYARTLRQDLSAGVPTGHADTAGEDDPRPADR